jgi:hypothetical protein
MVGQATVYLTLSDLPRAFPPSPESATLANHEIALESITYITYLNSGSRRDLNP